MLLSQTRMCVERLGFVDVGKWKTVARAGIFFVEPIGIPEDPDADLLGFLVTIPYASWKRPEIKRYC